MTFVPASTCVIDSYPKLNEEAFVAINARNLLRFRLVYFVNSWLAGDGVVGFLHFERALFVCHFLDCAVGRNAFLQRFMNDDF
jgi:hypothetical protein